MDIKPCPFCGSSKIETATGDFARAFVLCQECGGRMVVFGDVPQAIFRWNKRTEPKPVDRSKPAEKRNDGISKLEFKDVVDRIKNADHGTVITITGVTGCGKSTLALMLLRAFNGSDDLDALDAIIPADAHVEDCDAHKAYLIEDVVCSNTNIETMIDTLVDGSHRILIIVAPHFNNISSECKELSGDHTHDVCLISFKGPRGTFLVNGSVLSDSMRNRQYYMSSGNITQDDVNNLSEIQHQWIARRIEHDW